LAKTAQKSDKHPKNTERKSKKGQEKVHLSRYRPMKKKLTESLKAIGWRDIVRPGDTVTIKVNATHFDYLPGLTVTPELVSEFVKILRDRADRVIVGESNLQRVSAEAALKGCGIWAAAEKAGAEVVNFSKDKTRKKKLSGKGYFKSYDVPVSYLDCDVFASMPVFKTHKLTEVTLTIKNHFGCVTDDLRLKHHGYIEKVLGDMLEILKPRLVVMDGRIALEGDGPIAGLPKDLDLLLTATNAVAADSVACDVMGFDARKIKHIRHAHDRGLGPIDLKKIELSGIPPKDARDPFDKANQDSISNLEKWVSPHPVMSRLIYRTFFTPMKWASWKWRTLTGYKGKYVRDIKKRELWDEYNWQGLFK